VKAAIALLTVPSLLLAGTLGVALHDQQIAASCDLTTASGAAGTTARLDTAQVGNARIITAVATQLHLPARAAVVAVATAKTESDLRNLPRGDRDSLGLFQQRPSQAWGTPDQLLDPVTASASFYNHLAQVPGWQTLPVTVAAQAVQRSTHPDAYERWEPLGTTLVAAIQGDANSAAICLASDQATDFVGNTGGHAAETMGTDGLTARTRTVLLAVRNAFGLTDIGGYCPGGCNTGHIAGSDHYTGHAIDIMLLPISDASGRVGDDVAAWLIANAQRYAIKYLIWNGRIWSTARSAQGWRSYTPPSGSTNDPTLMHRDHIHVSVY
jgi:hypothetical protein